MDRKIIFRQKSQKCVLHSIVPYVASVYWSTANFFHWCINIIRFLTCPAFSAICTSLSALNEAPVSIYSTFCPDLHMTAALQLKLNWNQKKTSHDYTRWLSHEVYISVMPRSISLQCTIWVTLKVIYSSLCMKMLSMILLDKVRFYLFLLLKSLEFLLLNEHLNKVKEAFTNPENYVY